MPAEGVGRWFESSRELHFKEEGMRGEKMKQAVQDIANHARYANTGDACRDAMSKDTPEAYARALDKIITGPNRSSEYAVNIDKAERALREDS